MGIQTLAGPPQVPAAHISFEDFLSAYDGVHAEWVDGSVVPMRPGNTPQPRLTRFLATLLQLRGEEHGLGEAFVAPLAVRMLDTAAREPDVFFFRRERLDRVHPTFADGPPDLVIEIISPSSRGLDRGEKFHEYEQAGVPEYWLIDPDRRKVEAYRLAADGIYGLVPLGDPEALRAEALPGMAIMIEWLWQEPLPHVNEVQRAWGLI